MHKSFWSDSVEMPHFKSLQHDEATDVLIIGGGICGILCAYFLEQANVKYILLEADRIGGGTTKNTTAKITSQHGLIYSKMIKEFGREKAGLYLQANEDAITRYRELCRDTDCDFEEKDAYTYTLTDREKVTDEVRAVNSLGFHAEFFEKTALPFPVKGAIKMPGQAQFHPLKFLAEISKGLNIRENTFVKGIDSHTAITDKARVTAKKIIVTTHFPFINKHGGYFVKLYQHRSYVIALKDAPDINGMYVDEAPNGMSFRNHAGLLFIGGGDHRTGKHGGNREELCDFAKRFYPNASEEYTWAAQDCMSLDGLPYIGRYSAGTPDLYTASGFNKWGITSAMVAASLLTDLVTGKENKLEKVFSPQRSIWRPQLAVNGFEAVFNLLTPSVRRCPHMGCALKWNPAEHSWDCPCHGSRFTKDGKLIDNPAQKNAKVK